MDSPRSIVVAVNFQPTGAVAAATAVRLSQWNDAQVTPVHVSDPASDATVRGDWPGWSHRSARVGAADPQLTVRHGAVATQILAEVAERRADLLVLGAGPPPGTSPIVAACARSAPIDLLVARGAAARAFTRILACIDFSPSSLRSAWWAARIAAQDNASLELVHAFMPPWHMLRYRAPTRADPVYQRQYQSDLEDRLLGFCRPALARFASSVPCVRPVLLPSVAPRRALIDYAGHAGADLVVLGSGRRGLGSRLIRALTKPLAERLLSDLLCSVLTVPSDRTPRAGDTHNTCHRLRL